MKQKFSEFYNSLVERFSSPFFSAFILSWLVINWKVPFALLRFNHADLNREGYDTFFQFVPAVVTSQSGLWYPLSAAIGYSFLYPAFKNLIIAWHEFTAKWGSKLNLKASKNKWVSIDRYMILRQQVDKSLEDLQELVNTESITRGNNLTLSNELTELRKSLTIWRTGPQILNGVWKPTHDIAAPSFQNNRLEFRNGSVLLRQETGDIKIGYIQFFAFNGDTSEMGLFIAPSNKTVYDVRPVFWSIRFASDSQSFTGHADDLQQISYQKIDT
jgi:hypothetical protein